MKPLKLRQNNVLFSPDGILSQVRKVSDPNFRSTEGSIALIEEFKHWEKAKENGYTIGICRKDVNVLEDFPYIKVDNDFAPISEGDVIGFSNSNKQMRLIFRKNSSHNFFFITDRCDHYCLMCSQPPKNIEDSWRIDELIKAVPLIDRGVPAITLSGGEPFMYRDKLFNLLNLCKYYLPDTAIQVLTNGCAFSDAQVVKKWKDIQHQGLYPAIPLYSYEASQHDYVVQSQGAFDKTILGILRLANAGQRVSIRTVLSQQTVPYLVDMATWIARNIPFIEHIAFMGMEDVGFSLANQNILWMDPVDYQEELSEALKILSRHHIPSSIYNLPYCVLNEENRKYSIQSISDWKNSFIDECDECSIKDKCAGFFSSGKTVFSRGVQKL